MMSFVVYPVPGHDRYYNKYINVKKGGIGGIAMLLAGYVVLSYVWEYDHISKKHLYTWYSTNSYYLPRVKIFNTPLNFAP